MAIQKQLKQEKVDRVNGKKSKQKRGSRFQSFHLTENQRKALLTDGYTLGEVIADLSEWLRMGYVLKAGETSDGVSKYASMSERSDDWKTARTMSFFHSDLSKALVGLWYYLVRVNPGWPEDTPDVDPEEIDF